MSNTKCLTPFVSTISKCSQITDGITVDDYVALDHSLLLLKYRHGLIALKECVRPDLLVFSNTALWRTPFFFNWIRTLATDLKDALLLLGWYVVNIGTPTEPYSWSEWAYEVTANASLPTFQNAQPVLRDFLYLDEAYGPAWERIWNEDLCKRALVSRACSSEINREAHGTKKHPFCYH